MAIGSVSLQGQITRAQDFSTIKQNEDNKVAVDQGNFQTHFQKEVKQNLSRVHESDNADNQNKKFDAKEKGKSEYTGDGGKRRNKQEEKMNIPGKTGSRGGFDIKI